VTKSDEIVAAMGGMFYGQEAPDMPTFVQKGSHFEKGDPLYIIEVMKMFNKVHATFSGTIDEVFVEGSGTIVQKGQPLFKINPDEKVVEEDPVERAARIRKNTDAFLAKL
jgi:biotin carboxyl carrier protein